MGFLNDIPMNFPLRKKLGLLRRFEFPNSPDWFFLEYQQTICMHKFTEQYCVSEGTSTSDF
jgi:hypothetical protein